ncbi:Fur-regulated basic protein FbpA [Bacillus alveayuensis]|jgi:hypothetical protein|uniref:Fur-regulated basic protein FbpA n=1 Tax=Aeribacillus alveayuensis TaxID=279215 RepID=A0ABT9VQE0_9BACI|nr:Fur-regulated basic protein FbpA [Bacillus alveayuensis]MDQ0163207.1 hypothetical protein [Bacillus alveayuensis]
MEQSFKDSLIEKIITKGVYKTEDGKQLYELNVIDLLKMANQLESDHNREQLF